MIALMELTGRPSFTVHDSCTHDWVSCARARDGAIDASVIVSAETRASRVIARRSRRIEWRWRCLRGDMRGCGATDCDRRMGEKLCVVQYCAIARRRSPDKKASLEKLRRSGIRHWR